MQVFLVAVLVDTLHVALEDAVEAFSCFRVHFWVSAAHILASVMGARTVWIKHRACTEALVLVDLISYDARLFSDVLAQDR